MSLAEIPCPLVDAILAASFCSRELHNRLSDLGLSPDRVEDTLSVAHRLLHHSPRLAVHLETQLDRMYIGSLNLAWETSEEELLEWCQRGDYQECDNLGGKLWSLVRDARPAVVAGASFLVSRITRDSVAAARAESET